MAQISETVTFNFKTEEQRRAFWGKLHTHCRCEDMREMGGMIDRYEAALTTIRDTLPERQDAYARLVFATAAEALEPETVN